MSEHLDFQHLLTAEEQSYGRGFWDVDQACERWLRKRGLIDREKSVEYARGRMRGLFEMQRRAKALS